MFCGPPKGDQGPGCPVVARKNQGEAIPLNQTEGPSWQCRGWPNGRRTERINRPVQTVKMAFAELVNSD